MGLNWKKPFTVHGSGPGNDIVIQGGVLYRRDGSILPSTIQGLETAGFQVPLELREHLVAEAAKRREDEVMKKVRQALKKAEAEMLDKVAASDAPLFDEHGEYLNLEGLDDLVEEAVASSRVVDPPAPAAKTKTKKK